MNDLMRIDCKANFVNLKSVDYENQFQPALLHEETKNYLSGDADFELGSNHRKELEMAQFSLKHTEKLIFS